MATRARPEMIGFRVTGPERREIETAAAYEGLNVAELCRSLVIPQVREKIRDRLGSSDQHS